MTAYDHDRPRERAGHPAFVIADGDIGSHFPPSDPKWKGAASDQFLAFAVELLVAGAGAVGYLIESMHGAGPPAAQRIMIGRQADELATLETELQQAKADGYRYERLWVCRQSARLADRWNRAAGRTGKA